MVDSSENRARTTYDAVANAYDAALRDELAGKPLDRALLGAVAELAGDGPFADVGCGPGHVTGYLAGLRSGLLGVDLSPEMVRIARDSVPGVQFTVASMTDLPAEDATWDGAVLLYSIIHLTDDERARAFRELARVLRPGGVMLVAFHVDSPEFATGDVNHLTDWFGHQVDLDGRFLDPDAVAGDLRAAGFSVQAELRRDPIPGAEYPSRRAYLIAGRQPTR